MIHYQKILKLHDERIILSGIAASTGNSRQKVTEMIHLAEKKGLVYPLDEKMTDNKLAVLPLSQTSITFLTHNLP